MIKAVVTPKNNNLSIAIPDDYIGKELELLIFAKEEVEINLKSKKRNPMADFKGILKGKDYKTLKSYSEKNRKEWERNI